MKAVVMAMRFAALLAGLAVASMCLVSCTAPKESHPLAQIRFGSGGSISVLPGGEISATIFEVPVSIGTNLFSANSVTTTVTEQTITITTDIVSCPAGKQRTADLRVLTEHGQVYTLPMTELPSGEFEATVGETPATHDAIQDICRTGDSLTMRVKWKCDGDVALSSGNDGKRVALVGCYGGIPTMLGDPKGRIDRPTSTGDGCDETAFASKEIELVEVKDWQIGSNNNDGTSTNATCYEKSTKPAGGWQWYHSAASGTAATQDPQGIQPTNKKQNLGPNGTFGWQGVANKCYYVKLTLKEGCTYFSDVVGVPSTVVGGHDIDQTKLIEDLNLHLPANGDCPTQVSACPENP